MATSAVRTKQLARANTPKLSSRVARDRTDQNLPSSLATACGGDTTIKTSFS
jgi:hypothetical protein